MEDRKYQRSLVEIVKGLKDLRSKKTNLLKLFRDMIIQAHTGSLFFIRK